MQKVINRKVYDTETANEIHSGVVSNEQGYSDTLQGLYESPNGQLFVAEWLLDEYGDKASDHALRLIDDDDDLADWLDKANAPVSAYKATGIEIAEG